MSLKQKVSILALAAVLVTGLGLNLQAENKVKNAKGYGVSLSAANIELKFPDGSVLFTPLNFDGESLEQLSATAGMAQELLDEAYEQLGLERSKSALPKVFSLSQNSPNPFNPSTTISYTIPDEQGEVKVILSVFNLRGQLVKSLVNSSQVAGAYNINWNGQDEVGRKVSSGVYFYRLRAGDFTSTRKMVVLK